MPSINEIKKDLYKSKELAEFQFYSTGQIYYKVLVLGSFYLFPIHIIQKTTKQVKLYQESEGVIIEAYIDTIKLSEDLGTTNFMRNIKGSDLIRWIQKAIENDEFIKISVHDI